MSLMVGKLYGVSYFPQCALGGGRGGEGGGGRQGVGGGVPMLQYSFLDSVTENLLIVI